MAEAVLTIFFVVAMSILGIQALTWVQLGEWPHIAIAMIFAQFGVALPKFDDAWLQGLAAWVLDLPLAVGVCIAGCVVASPIVLLEEAIRVIRDRHPSTAMGERDEVPN